MKIFCPNELSDANSSSGMWVVKQLKDPSPQVCLTFAFIHILFSSHHSRMAGWLAGAFAVIKTGQSVFLWDRCSKFI